MYFRGLDMLIITLRTLFWSLIPLSLKISFCCFNNTKSQRDILGAGNGYGLWETGDPSTIVLVGCPLGPV